MIEMDMEINLGRGCVNREAINYVFITVEFIVASILQSVL